MEHDVSYISILIIPIISFIFYLISKGLVVLAIFISSFFTLLSLYVFSNFDQKETLNVIMYNGRLYFNLSEDRLFSVELSEEKMLSEVIKKVVLEEMVTIRTSVDRIDFINFQDDILNRELNKLIQSEVN